MLWHLLHANHGELPQGAHALFCNTGREHDATLDFVHLLETRWPVTITWLEYRYRPHAAGTIAEPRHHYVIVDYESAARAGAPDGPYEQSIRARRMVPSPFKRFCTTDLKVRTIARYMARERGADPDALINLIGLRYDERARWMKAALDCAHGHLLRYPMVQARVTRGDVHQWWRTRNFGLELPETGHWGNCDFCFFKSRAALLQNARARPDLLAWWVDMEGLDFPSAKRTALQRREIAQFRDDLSMAQLREIAARTPELPFAPDEPPESLAECLCTD